MKNKDITTHIIQKSWLTYKKAPVLHRNPQCYIEKAGRKSDGIYDKYTAPKIRRKREYSKKKPNEQSLIISGSGVMPRTQHTRDWCSASKEKEKVTK